MSDTLNEVESLLDNVDKKTKAKSERVKKGTKAKPVKKLTKKEIQIAEMSNNTVLPDKYFTVWSKNDLDLLCDWLQSQPEIAVDTETMGVNPFKDEIVGISFYAPDKGYYIPLKHKEHTNIESIDGTNGIDYVTCLDKDIVANKLRPILEDNNKRFILHNSKFDQNVLMNWLRINLTPYYDTMIAQAILDETKSKALKDLATSYLKIPSDTFSTLFGNVTFDNVPIRLNPNTRTGNLASFYAIKDTELTYKLYKFQDKYLQTKELKELHDLFYNVEMPFLNVVFKAEQHGVRLDEDYLINTVSKKLHEEVEELRQKIWAHVGNINLNSPAQVSYVFYKVLNLPQINKDKPNSVDKNTLKKIRHLHPVVQMLMDYKEKTKLTTAFADKLPKAVINGRVHASFNTVGAATGRMSSSNPNLQQIPARTGNLIRNAFVSDEGRLLVSCDFSQQELRVLAHVSNDKVLLDIYRDGKDVHSMTAVGMFNRTNPNNKVSYEDFEYRRSIVGYFQDKDGNINPDKFDDADYISNLINDGKIKKAPVDKLREYVNLGVKYEKIRKSAKVVNFGIIYGMGEKKLANTLEITEEEAVEYIEGYFDAYPGVKKWMKEQKKFILANKYSKTMLGRKRRLYPELDSGKFWMVQGAVRKGVNAVIQGSSADMVKIASVKLQPLLEELDAKIVMWIHDELIIDAPSDIGMDNIKKITDIMCTALPLTCGLKSDVEAGERWGQRMSEDELDSLRDELEELDD